MDLLFTQPDLFLLAFLAAVGSCSLLYLACRAVFRDSTTALAAFVGVGTAKVLVLRVVISGVPI